MKLSKENIGQLVEIEKVKDNKNIKYKGYIINFNIHKKTIDVKLLDNEYNISVVVDDNTNIKLLDSKIKVGKPPTAKIVEKKDLPNVLFISTGGTIGTHVDYKTGGVSMSRTPEEIIATTPELSNIINIKNIKNPVTRGSEDIEVKAWKKIAQEVYSGLVDDNIDGIIISHGTDTLCWTGSAISFMIENINKPILLVGAQRSPDRASFDGSMNLICASRFIQEKIPGVYTVMHSSMNDDSCDIIRAVKCKKLHTSRRDAFKAVNDTPIARVYENGKIEYLQTKDNILKYFNNKKPILNIDFEEKVAIVKAYPNSDPKILDWYIDQGYKALIIEGTALGHVPIGSGGNDPTFPKSKNWLPYIEKANKKGIILIMCSQSLFGRVNSKVYSNLRYINQAGVEYLNQHDMLYSTAYIKLGIALGRFDNKKDIINYMQSNIIGEISNKEIPKSFDNLK
jgi:glutamyl-tRNA(Gln) amidotransferase subunit D